LLSQSPLLCHHHSYPLPGPPEGPCPGNYSGRTPVADFV
jgi:hypothetical protein